jgi:hypothetical protein
LVFQVAPMGPSKHNRFSTDTLPQMLHCNKFFTIAVKGCTFDF